MKDNRAKISDARTGGIPSARGGYVSPVTELIEFNTKINILQNSLDGNPSNNPWREGSDSGFDIGYDE